MKWKTGAWTSIYALLASLLPFLASGQIGPPPVITVNPVSVSVLVGTPASFSVVVVSTTKLSYNWYRNGTLINNAHSSSISIKSPTSSDAGNYTVIVANASGSATSTPALLTVVYPPEPLQFVASTMLSNGYWMRLTGPTGYNYVIYAGRDLANWTAISTNPAPTGLVEFIDYGATNRTRRFYKGQVTQ